MMPYVGKYWVSELLVVLFYSPLLVSLGAGTINYKATQKLRNYQVKSPILSICVTIGQTGILQNI
jgi:hypothetical protein